MLRNLVLSFLFLTAALGLCGADRFELVSMTVPEEAAPGEKVTANVTLKVVSVDEPAYLRPGAEYSFPASKTALRLPAAAMQPWKLEKPAAGDTVKCAASFVIPETVQPGETGTVSFHLWRPDTKKYAAIGNSNDCKVALRIKAPAALTLPAAQTPARPVLVVPKMAAPQLDGDVAAAEWQSALTIPALVNNADGKPAAQGTQIKIGYDGETLFVAMIATEANPDAILRDAFPHHDGQVWNNDGMDLIFRPDLDSTDYTQFIADTLNQRFDALSGDFAGFNPPWRSAARVDRNGWSIEAAIPLSAVTAQKVQSGTIWQADFFRQAERGRTIAAWVATRGGNVAINSYGYLVFESLREGLLRQAQFMDKAGELQSPELTKLSARMAELRRSIAAMTEPELANRFSAILVELRDARQALDKMLFAARFATSASPLVIQTADPYDGRAPGKGDNALLDRLKADFCAGETRDFAFNLSNISDRPMTVRCSLRYGKTPGITVKSPDHLRLGLPGFKIEWFTPTLAAAFDGTPASDVLTPNPGGSYRIAPGETIQAFLSVTAPDAAASCNGFLVIQATDKSPFQPLALPVEFSVGNTPPDAACRPLAFGWDYLPGDIAGERPEFAEKHFRRLQEYNFNMAMISGLRLLPRPRADQSGNLVGELDFGKLRNHIALLGNKFDYYYLNVDIWEKQQQRRDLFGLDFNDPAYEKAFKNWFGQIAAELARLGIPNAKLVVCPYDESLDRRAETIARWIKETAPDTRILINCSSTDLEQVKSIDRYVSVWMPHLRTLNQEAYQDFYRYLNSTGKPVLVYYYSTGNNEKTKSPYGDYLLHFWRCYERGLGGVGFWAAGQYYGDPWYREGYPAVYDSTLLYPTETEVLPSRRLAAWRRGFADLALLRQTGAVLAARDDREGLAQLKQNAGLVADYPNDHTRAEAMRQYCRSILNP